MDPFAFIFINRFQYLFHLSGEGLYLLLFRVGNPLLLDPPRLEGVLQPFHLARDLFLPSVCHLIVSSLMTLDASLFNFGREVPARDGRMAFHALHAFRHDVGQAIFLSEGFSLNELYLTFVTFCTIRCGLMMTPQALYSGLANLSMFVS